MLQLRRESTLDGGDHGWLKARHHFVVSPDGNRDHGPIGSLVVWNDDEIAPGTGFGLHGHANIEIVTYVREGTVTHRDSMGNVGHTNAGDVQVISAGTGIRHSEHNRADVPLRLFQIWLRPRADGGAPQWSTQRFPQADRPNRLVALASGMPSDQGALPIRADARVLGATLLAGATIEYELGTHRQAYLAPTRGTVMLNGQTLQVGDGIAIWNEEKLTISTDVGGELIFVDTA
jgi:redox-sensitive bicupin YhaK (pirin superfamily)